MKGGPPAMESTASGLSSLKGEEAPPYVSPHYRESYRLAIYALLCGGREAYREFLRAEQLSHLLSDDEVLFILHNAQPPAPEEEGETTTAAAVAAEDTEGRPPDRPAPPPSTYFPLESDEEVPDLDLGWPQVPLDHLDTSISLLFQPPRHNTPTIKEVLRKQIQEAKQVVAIAMDVFTDVDLFKEVINATLRGVVVYLLLDHAHFKGFHTMATRVGVNIQDFKNLRVRTVQGQQYQCRSGDKFHGGLEQKFIVVDCRTVLYGTYSYSWSFEKINLSMVLVITGQLVGSFDEEFRRLYARSSVPSALSQEASSALLLRDMLAMHSPNSSQLSLHQIHMRSKVLQGMRGAQDAGVLTRGLSVQERLHQSHVTDLGNLVRGHSYGGELQKLGSMSRLRMGTKDIGVSERAGSNQRAGVETLLSNRLSQQHMRHRARYGPDQNLIPFNSETSLHRWKMDAYMNDSNGFLDASCEALSPMMSPVASPYSSRTGLNEHQTQTIHSRSRDIKSRLEEMRHNRLSLQDYSQLNLKQSHESLRSAYPSLDRSKYMSGKGQEVRPGMAELEAYVQDAFAKEPSAEPAKASQKKEQILTNANRSTSYGDIVAGQERKAPLAYDWHEPISRTTSAAELDMKLNEKSFKLSHMPPSGHAIQHPRPMESLSEIPEEKEGSNSRVNSSESTALKDETQEERPKDREEKPLPKLNSMQSAESCHQDVDSVGKELMGPGPAAAKEKAKASEPEAPPKIMNRSTSLEARGAHTDKEQEDPPLPKKTSMKPKVSPALPDERKPSKKELQRKSSLRSQSSSGSNQPSTAESSLKRRQSQSSSGSNQPSTAESSLKRGQSQSFRLNNSAPDTDKHKSPLLRLAPQRSSKKKSNPAAEQDRAPSAAPDHPGAAIYHQRREKAYSRYEYLLNETTRTEREKASSLNRQEYPAYQSGSDNKLGRFMQRVGSLIHKNK